jgi:hypothetical protein
MKTAFYLLGVLALVVSAVADPNRYPTRSFTTGNVELQPLFSWWTFASQTTNPPLDITEVDSNKLAAISNLWLRLPPRPLPDWLRVTARQNKIIEAGPAFTAGAMWKVDATIEPAPMMVKQETIYLRHPPAREIEDFRLAYAAIPALQNAQLDDMAAEAAWKNNLEAEAQALFPTNAPPPLLPVQRIDAEIRRFKQDVAATDLNLTNAQTRTQARARQLAAASAYLALFPDSNVYWLDHFALRTGDHVDGLEVYDMGIAPGLTY